ncbi:hypothetical protein [Tardiphaga sp.]|jgi:hypothetical protein|uniref:hypothetical protein n=1 Tax=Tardiphaga sp. TaxID=1926292 RepID=UPI0037D9B477
MPLLNSQTALASLLADHMCETMCSTELLALKRCEFGDIAVGVHRTLFDPNSPGHGALVAVFGSAIPPVEKVRAAVTHRSACPPFWLANRHARLHPSPALPDPDLSPEQMALDEMPDHDEDWDSLPAAALSRSVSPAMAST